MTEVYKLGASLRVEDLSQPSNEAMAIFEQWLRLDKEGRVDEVYGGGRSFTPTPAIIEAGRLIDEEITRRRSQSNQP